MLFTSLHLIVIYTGFALWDIFMTDTL